MTICVITGKSWMSGNRVSHSNIKTKRKINANIQKRRIFDVKRGCFVRVSVSASGLRNLNKKSISFCLNKFGNNF